MDVDSFLNLEKRTGIKDSDIDDFVSKANAVDEAIRGMRDGTVDPDKIQIDGVDCDSAEVREEKERKRLARRAELEREAEELRIKRKEEERKKWWAGVELFAQSGPEESTASVDDIDRAQVEKNIRKERYSMDYSRWNQWQPSDPVSLKEIQEKEEEEDRKRNEEFEKNNAEWCKQYLSDIEKRDKATAKKKQESANLKLKGNKFFKAKNYADARDKYMEALALTPYDGTAILTNVAQAYIKLQEYDDALEFLERAIALDPKCIKAYSRKAFILSECIPNRLEESVQWAEKAYMLDEGHTNKEVTVQYNELKLSWADRCKEKNVQEIVVPAASKFSDLMNGNLAKTEEKTPDPSVSENIIADLVKEMTTADGPGGSISSSAGISVIDNLKSRLGVMLKEGLPEDTSKKADGDKGAMRNHDMFLAAALEVLESDSNTRVYMRTCGALGQLLELMSQGLANIKEAKEDNRKANFNAVGKHMKLLAVAISSERSSKLQLLEIKGFVDNLKFICSLGDITGELLEGCLLVLFYGLDATCSKMRNEILKDKTFLLTLGSALCTINTMLSKKTKKHKPSPTELSFLSSSQLICCQLIKDVVFADEAKENIPSIAVSVVPILGSTLAAENNIPKKTKKEVLAFVFESLLGCSQIEVLRVAFTHEVLDSSDSTIDVLLELCHEHNWMVSNGLAILMNLTIKDLAGIDIRRVVYDSGATDLCLCILNEEGKFAGPEVTSYSFVRAAGLMARLSVVPDVQETLQSATVYQTLCQRLIRNIALATSQDKPWITDERNQLIRVIASVRDLSYQVKQIGFSLQLPQELLSLLPMPRQELNKVTPTSVILPPLEPMNATIVGNIALSLLPYADDKEHLSSVYLGKSLGVEKLVCAMATCQDMRVRKNIAILLAKGCRDAAIKKQIEYFRGLQMIVELQKHLV
mmetsp:Transcript_18858/g.31477  ORF Transcript_18858/g.31477 Transcript_18858/m.31477 type:complete len:928 (+) Transcript_18858:73-2856(+)